MSIRTTFVMVMFLTVVAGYFLLADFRGGAASEPTAPWFYTANMEDIQRIQFKTKETAIGFFQKDEEQKEPGKEPTNVKVWRFNDEFAMPVDVARWGGITLLLSGPQSRRALLRKLEEPERFGLTDPRLNVDVDLTGDRSVRVRLGDKTPDNLNYYIVQEGNPGLYLIDGSWGDVLSKMTREPPYPKWYYKLPPEKVLFLHVTHDGREAAFLRERFVGEPDRWRFSGREGKPVAAERWTKEVQPILGGPPKFRLLQRGVGDPAKYGLGTPATVVRVEYEPPFEPQQDDPEPELRRTLELRIGNPLPDGSGHYAQPYSLPFPVPQDKSQAGPAPEDYLVFVDKDWLDVMTRLITTPPVAPEPAASPGGS